MTTNSPRSVLVVDDDVRLCEMIAAYLSDHEFEVRACHTGDEAVELIGGDAPPDLVILDLMLPGTDGLSVCRQVRNDYKGYILMLTALDDSADEIAGLEMGADDYLAKPVKPRLLLARVRSLLRRQSDRSSTDADSSPPQRLSIGKLTIDRSSRSTTFNGEAVRMTTTEFDLLWLMAEQAGTTLSRSYLHERMYRLDLNPADRRIDLLISRLRKKLGDDSTDPVFLKTVRGQGYLLSTAS